MTHEETGPTPCSGPGCSVLRLRSNRITNEQTTQLAKRPICRRPQRSSPPSWCDVLSGHLGHRRQGARQARICPRGFLVGRCSASSAGRFPRTSLTVRGFAGAGGVVDFGGKRAAGGTFGCSACDVCFIRSAKFSAGAEFDEAEAHSARFASIAASCARACASSSWETVPAGLPLRSTRQAPCRSRC